MDDLVHGTCGGYKKEWRLGIGHCQACRDAVAEYRRRWRASKTMASVEVPVYTEGALVTLEALPERFRCRIQVSESGCWVWTGSLYSNGYGIYNRRYHNRLAHREAWMMLVGPIPDGLELDHLCRNRPCVNPKHMEIVTRLENMRRVFDVHGNPSIKRRLWTHCKKGHEFTEENTYIDLRGNRGCRICRKATSQRYREARKAAQK